MGARSQVAAASTASFAQTGQLCDAGAPGGLCILNPHGPAAPPGGRQLHPPWALRAPSSTAPHPAGAVPGGGPEGHVGGSRLGCRLEAFRGRAGEHGDSHTEGHRLHGTGSKAPFPGHTERPWGQPDAAQLSRESRGRPHLEALGPLPAGTQAAVETGWEEPPAPPAAPASPSSPETRSWGFAFCCGGLGAGPVVRRHGGEGLAHLQSVLRWQESLGLRAC